MSRRVFLMLVSVCALCAQATTALATPPSLVSTTPANGALNQGRYRLQVAFRYSGPVAVSAAPTVVRVSNGSHVTSTYSVIGATVQIHIAGSLASAQAYQVTVLPDGAATPNRVTFHTLPPPAHPTLHVAIVTSLTPAAVLDIAHRLDRANLFAPFTTRDFDDVAVGTGTALTAADLNGHQAAFVVTDESVVGQAQLANALTTFVKAGHGVVVGGSPNWTSAGPRWTATTSIGATSSVWGYSWSLFQYRQPPAIQGGALARGTIVKHFLTRYLTSLAVQNAGSGEELVQNAWSGTVLARLAKHAPYSSLGQSLLAERAEGHSRVVDLGFRPWSSAIEAGGLGVNSSQAGPLIARSLWWATNRIAPVGIHFTKIPKSPTPGTSVLFTMAASDPDFDGQLLKYHYRVNAGPWKVASSNSVGLFFLKQGGYYTVHAYATDDGGNRTANTAVMSFHVSPTAAM